MSLSCGPALVLSAPMPPSYHRSYSSSSNRHSPKSMSAFSVDPPSHYTAETPPRQYPSQPNHSKAAPVYSKSERESESEAKESSRPQLPSFRELEVTLQNSPPLHHDTEGSRPRALTGSTSFAPSSSSNRDVPILPRPSEPAAKLRAEPARRWTESNAGSGSMRQVLEGQSNSSPFYPGAMAAASASEPHHLPSHVLRDRRPSQLPHSHSMQPGEMRESVRQVEGDYSAPSHHQAPSSSHRYSRMDPPAYDSRYGRGTGSTPGSPYSRAQGVDPYIHGPPAGGRFRALSTNDRPLMPLPHVRSPLLLSTPERDEAGRSGRVERGSVGAVYRRRSSPNRKATSPRSHWHQNVVNAREGESRAWGPYPRGPEDGGSLAHRAPSRYHPYSPVESRGSTVSYASGERYGSSRTSPPTSVLSSPPLKGYKDRYGGESSTESAGARGMVGASAEMDGHMYDGPRLMREYPHSPGQHGESAPPNMKRTRNGYKYSCGIQGPACHMAGCPVAEITEEYEYLKTLPEKDRWRPLVIPLGNRNHPQHVADYLKRWRLSHYDEPYLTKELSEHLRVCLGLREEKQMSDWMTNARRRY